MVEDIKRNSKVGLSLQGDHKPKGAPGIFISLEGDAEIVRDTAKFEEHWTKDLDRWFEEAWVDLGRELGGDGPGPYTWWSWRGQAFDNDAGWRIDYHVATSGLAARARRATVGRAPSYDKRWSDHAPVTVDFA